MRSSKGRAATLVAVVAMGVALFGWTAWADSQGPNFASTLGTAQEWFNNSNALGTNDNVCASESSSLDSIDLTGFGFSIPAGATITGIIVEPKFAGSDPPPGSVTEVYVRLLKAGTTAGTAKQLTAVSGQTTCATSAFRTLGSASDLWGTTWTPAQINAANFGVRITTELGLDGTAYVDAVRITVHYTLPTTGTIVIVKDAVPNDAQDFEFSRSFGANFFLDDDSDGTLPNTTTFSGVAAGTHTVTELGPPAGWTLTDLICTDPDNGSTVDLNMRTATIDLDAGETVTCTFTNKTHDLVVTKTDDIDPAKTNQLVTYTITVTNNGPSDASNVTVTDTLPTNGVTFVSATPSQGGPCTLAANVVTCPLGTIANGNSATVTIQVRYTTTGTKTNTVSASSTLPDFNTSNNLNQTEITTVTQSCPSVTFTTTTPSSVTFTSIGEKKLIIVSVTNRSGAPIQVISFEPQVGEPFTVFSVFPALPWTIAKGGVQRFDVTVQGTAVAVATKPYFYINASCGVAATASDPRLLVPLQLEKLQAEVRSGFLQLEARGEGIESVQVQLFNLSGRKLIDQTSAGATLTVPLVNDKGQRLAKGVYLYIVTVRGWDDQVIRSEIRKLVILR